MSSELIDLTAPAYDPETPKPRGLLPVPPEIEAIVAREEARIAQQHGVRIAPEARKRMTDDLTLQYYHEGTDVACRETPRDAGQTLQRRGEHAGQHQSQNGPQEDGDAAGEEEESGHFCQLPVLQGGPILDLDDQFVSLAGGWNEDDLAVLRPPGVRLILIPYQIEEFGGRRRFQVSLAGQHFAAVPHPDAPVLGL